MSNRETRRIAVVEQYMAGIISQKKAAEILAISIRQFRRIVRRYKTEGAKGLVHKGRGKAPNNKIPDTQRDAILARYEKCYDDFGPTLAAEYLENDGLAVHAETLRRWLTAKGLWKRKRKRKQHRMRRERKQRFGEMLQLDGSFHDWFEARANDACLMNLVDDATGITLSLLSEQETTFAAMEVLHRWIRRYGVPETIYCDLKSVYITKREPTIEEQIAGKLPLTQFGRACAELGIRIIPAYSPQAKGRVERNHAVYQDRFVKALRLKNATTIEEANRLLQGGFIADINRRFARKPADMADAHIPVPPRFDLRSIFCIKETRTLSEDWTIQYNSRVFQVTKRQKALPAPRAKIDVWRWENGDIALRWEKHSLRYVEITKSVKKQG